MIRRTLPLLLFFLLACESAWAHRLIVFAYVDGGAIKASANFGKDRPAKNIPVELRGVQSEDVFAEGRTNESGEVSIPLPQAVLDQPQDLLVVFRAGQGHRNQWRITAASYGGATEKSHRHPQESSQANAEKISSSTGDTRLNPDVDVYLEKIVEGVVRREIAPLKAMVAEQAASGPGLQEIIGGLGWIVGIFGAAALGRASKTKGRS